MTDFSRSETLSALANRLWRYLGAAASVEPGAPPADLGLSISSDELEELLLGHLALAQTARRMVECANEVVDRLPSVASRYTAELDGEIEGDVDWGRTTERRWETGEESLFVCSPVKRQYESLHARVLKTALIRYERTALLSPFRSGSSGKAVGDLLHATQTALRKAKLAGVRPLPDPSERQLERVEQRYGMQPTVHYLRHLRDVLTRRAPETVTALFSEVVLAPASNADLFELKVGFDVVDGLVGQGFRLERLQAIAENPQPFAELTRGDNRIVVWYQKALGRIPNLALGSSVYGEVRKANGLRTASLRPDFVLVDHAANRIVLLEVKLKESTESGQPHVSRGIADAFAYLHDYPQLAGQPTPRVVVVGWGATSTPSVTSEVTVCSQQNVAEICTELVAE
jgi:hypothetical protein